MFAYNVVFIMRFYCPISKIWLMERDRTKRAMHVTIYSYLLVLCSRSFKVIKSMVLL